VIGDKRVTQGDRRQQLYAALRLLVLAAGLGVLLAWRPGLLRDREGWWFSTQDREPPRRCFGRDNAARLVITPEPDGFLMFIHDKKSCVIPGLDDVKAWLDEHEHEYEGLTPLQEEFRRALESGEIRPFGEGDGGSPASGRPGFTPRSAMATPARVDQAAGSRGSSLAALDEARDLAS
jgi:hypothetical protein